jgi:hypothetical protein
MTLLYLFLFLDKFREEELD